MREFRKHLLGMHKVWTKRFADLYSNLYSNWWVHDFM
jgi:hypothetical protein